MKKGFTLVELIIVIVLLGIIVTIASISIMEFKKSSDEKLMNEKIKYIETSALKWGKEHLNDISSSGTIKTVGYLINNDYIIGDNDSKDALLIPGTNDTFNNKYVCIKYENIYLGSSLNDFASSYNYHGNTNYQVTAKYKGNTNSCN